MGGKTNRDNLSGRLDWIEGAAAFAGIIVVAGLLIEDGPEIWTAILTWTWPQRAVSGGSLVTLGVLLEVALTFVATRIAKRIDSKAADDVAKALERAAKAEQAAAEANLERLKTERRILRLTLNRTSLDEDERKQLKEKMELFSGTSFCVIGAASEDSAMVEPIIFSGHLSMILHEAGWIEEKPKNFSADSVRGLTIECEAEAYGAGVELGRSLARLQISSRTSMLHVDAMPSVRIRVGYL